MKQALRFGADVTKDSGFSQPNFFRVFKPCTKIAQFLSSNLCSRVAPVDSQMSFSHMFFGSQAFKVFGSVVSFIAVNMVNVFVGGKSLKPTRSHDSVHKTLSAKRQIPHAMLDGGVRLQLSKNFSATRNSVKMIVGSVFDSVHNKANHVGSLSIVSRSSYH